MESYLSIHNKWFFHAFSRVLGLPFYFFCTIFQNITNNRIKKAPFGLNSSVTALIGQPPLAQPCRLRRAWLEFMWVKTGWSLLNCGSVKEAKSFCLKDYMCCAIEQGTGGQSNIIRPTFLTFYKCISAKESEYNFQQYQNLKFVTFVIHALHIWRR